MKYGKPRTISAGDLPALNDNQNAIRQVRKEILAAFDIYKSNVYYGVIEETEEEHAEVMAWYRSICDLQLNAVENVPEKVRRYLQ